MMGMPKVYIAMFGYQNVWSKRSWRRFFEMGKGEIEKEKGKYEDNQRDSMILKC